MQSRVFIKNLRLAADASAFCIESGSQALEFESANPSVVKSIKQRDLLNTWLRLYAREQSMPRIENISRRGSTTNFRTSCIYTVDTAQQPPRLTIQSDGTRMSSAYGHTGKGRYLDEYLGARLAPIVMPVYYECIARGLPVYTISNIDDIYGRIVAYERLLLPFSEGGDVTHVIASLKTISEDGGFEIRNLMRGNDTLPTAETSRHHRSRSLPPRARPHSGRRRDRIRLVRNGIRERQSLGGQIDQAARCCSTRGCARCASHEPCPRSAISSPTASPTNWPT